MVRIGLVLVALLALLPSAPRAPNPKIGLSWGACSPIVRKANFGDASSSRLVVFTKSFTVRDANIGSDH